LVVIDGAKGLRKAVDETFGEKAVIQRCSWHKKENVVSYLKKED
jgi:putative transposase